MVFSNSSPFGSKITCFCVPMYEDSKQPVPVQWNIELKQQRDRRRWNLKKRQIRKDWATRAPVAQTLQTVRQTCSRTTATCAYTFVQVPFSGNFKPTRTSPLKQRVETTTWSAAAETSKKRQITSCLGRTGQHARPSRKHCKPCADHAHAPPPRARTRLHGFPFSEKFKPTRYHPMWGYRVPVDIKL